MTVVLRTLSPGEEAMLDAFLATTPETTIFLRSNLARAGLVDDGSPFTGTYAGAFDGDRLVGAAAIFWNRNIVVGPGPHAEAVARHAVERSGKTVAGILGPYAEVVRVREALDLTATPARTESRELLYTLALGDLAPPAALREGRVAVRAPRDAEMPGLMDWRMQYSRETSAMDDTPVARQKQAVYLDAYQRDGHHFVVTDGAELVAYSAFNATVADIVQIGGVWTPPALRGRGYARCAVAGSLQHARIRGVNRAVLFTGEDNLPAQRSYVAIGFRLIGEYGIVFFGA